MYISLMKKNAECSPPHAIYYQLEEKIYNLRKGCYKESFSLYFG